MTKLHELSDMGQAVWFDFIQRTFTQEGKLQALIEQGIRGVTSNLAKAGAWAWVQRPLWASTGTKNPAYPDTLYVDSLIAPNTVNTVPPATLEAFMDHGHVKPMTDKAIEGARARMVALLDAGVNLEIITQTLLDEGLIAFSKAFEGLMGSITGKRDQIQSQG